MDCEEGEMTNLRAHKRWIYVGIILHLTGCSVEGGSDGTTSAPTTTGSGAARVELASNTTSVDYDGSITLSWTTNQVQDCVALGDWSGDKSTSGTETIGSLKVNSTFELACTEIDDGSTSGSIDAIAYKGRKIKDSVDISVRGPKPPAISLSASPSAVPVNGSTTISWSSQRASDCEASGGWSGNRATRGTERISGLIANSTFMLTCNGKGGSTEDSVSISIVAPSAPWASLTANSLSLPYGGSTTLSWDSGNTSGCSASGDWSGSLATAGSQSTGTLTADSTFNLICTGAGGSAIDSVSITVAAPLPTLSFSASPGSVNTNGSATLSWAGTDVTSCTASGDWSGNKVTAGSQTINAIAADSQFILTCSGTGGSVNRTVNVTVAAPPPTLSFSASPGSVNTNGSTTLSWAGTDVTSCTASGDWSGNKVTAGSQTINAIAADSQFILTCSGTGGSVNRTVNVTVLQSSNGTALLSWTPPTRNTDDSPLQDLVGYKIRYGTSPGNYSETITLSNPGLSSYLVENLSPADWFFVMTSFNTSNIESGYSSEVSKTIN
jgi:hypothetical protein